MSAKIGVLALQGDVREHCLAVAELGGHPVEVRQPEDLAGVDALILPGGESTTISLLLASAGLWEPIAERLHVGMPAMGTCARMSRSHGSARGCTGRPEGRERCRPWSHSEKRPPARGRCRGSGVGDADGRRYPAALVGGTAVPLPSAL